MFPPHNVKLLIFLVNNNIKPVRGIHELYFTQDILFDYTIDSYKAPALNTKSRCFEILTAIEDIKEERLLSGTLKPMLEEWL
ncbi:MAG TPA: hypothetical protein VKL21_12085 [Candidatus Methanoperedens sp.]|nr:hypothetical protein [Candidatus Methanoperedens sp.]